MKPPDGLSQVYLVGPGSRLAGFVRELAELMPADPEELLDACVEPKGALFVVMRGTRPAGLAAIRGLDDRVAEFVALVVHPEFRELGLGRRLVGAVLDAAERLGFSTISAAKAPLSSDAARLLSRHGFLSATRSGAPALEKLLAN